MLINSPTYFYSLLDILKNEKKFEAAYKITKSIKSQADSAKTIDES